MYLPAENVEYFIGVFKTLSNIYGGGFLRKLLTAKIRQKFSQKALHQRFSARF